MGFDTGAIARRVRAFVQDTRAGATAIASAAVTVMTVGGAALIVDHVWLYDQRDVLKTAAEAGAIAATLDIDRQLAKNPRISDADLKAALEPVAKRYVLANLAHLAPKRFRKAKKSLELKLDLDRTQRTVGVTARADLGGTLFSRNLPLLGNHVGPEKVAARAGVESESTPVEVVLAIDVSGSMQSSLDRGIYDAGNNAIDNVKRAARELVDILNPNGYDRVAVGIVPWYAAVRLDTQSAKRCGGRGLGGPCRHGLAATDVAGLFQQPPPHLRRNPQGARAHRRRPVRAARRRPLRAGCLREVSIDPAAHAGPVSPEHRAHHH